MLVNELIPTNCVSQKDAHPKDCQHDWKYTGVDKNANGRYELYTCRKCGSKKKTKVG